MITCKRCTEQKRRPSIASNVNNNEKDSERINHSECACVAGKNAAQEYVKAFIGTIRKIAETLSGVSGDK